MWYRVSSQGQGTTLGTEGCRDGRTGPSPSRWEKLLCPGLHPAQLSRRPPTSAVFRGSFLVSVPFSYFGRAGAAILRSDYLEDLYYH